MCGFSIILILIWKGIFFFKSHRVHAFFFLNKNINFNISSQKSALFLRFILSERNLFNICVLSQCIVYESTFNFHIPLHKKILFHTLLLLVFKIAESCNCILNSHIFFLAKFPSLKVYRTQPNI